MRRLFSWLFTRVLVLIGAILLPSASSLANPVTTENAQARLVSEVAAIQPGTPFWVALQLKIRDGWHTYWRNPGDSGLAITIEWSLPQGFQAGELLWPYPERIPVGPLMNYGYHGEVYLLTQIASPSRLPEGREVTLTAHAHWLVCEESCIPEEARLDLLLPMAESGAPPALQWADAFARTRRALPEASPWGARFQAGPERITLTAAIQPLQRIEDVWFYPYEYGLIEHAAPQPSSVSEDGVTLSIPRGELRAAAIERLEGVVVLKEDTAAGFAVRAFAIRALPVAELAGGISLGGLPQPSLIQAVVFALLGGIILNLMPCVLPVLSVKVLSFLQHGQAARGELRKHGLAFTGGVLASFALLAGLLIALRAGGSHIGWGFQLQSPVVVALLAYLMFVLGLSLSGVFTIGGALMGVGDRLARRGGYGGSFATGVLAAVVASPCTAPFMGASMGFALTQSWPVALAVFEALGLGLAVPYLLLSFSPSLQRFLPKPGPWMARIKELLAFPLYGTAAWLVWILSRQAGPAGVAAALAGMILLAFAAWLWRSAPATSPAGRLTSLAGTVAATVAALTLAARLAPVEATGPELMQEARQGPVWERFSRERLADLRADGRPVFLNLTAAWCITCLVNERIALSSSQIAARFTQEGVAYLRGDWTNRDPEITEVLTAFGRSGVPLYVLYPAAGTADGPMVLPQILTETLLLQALDQVHDRSGAHSSM